MTALKVVLVLQIISLVFGNIKNHNRVYRSGTESEDYEESESSDNEYHQKLLGDPEQPTNDTVNSGQKANNSSNVEENVQTQTQKYDENGGFDLSPEEIQKFKMWPEGIIPYYIDVPSFDKKLRDKIRNRLYFVNSATSVNFVELQKPPSDENKRYVMFINRRNMLDCADHSVTDFTNSGVQRVVLGYDCMETGHEIDEAVMSILGVAAQHNAPDRDNFITVHMENIKPDKKHLFEKLNDDAWLFHDLQHDYHSATHYDLNKHSANGHATITFVDKNLLKSKTKYLTETDIHKINMLYDFITRMNTKKRPVCDKLFKVNSDVKSNNTKPIRPRKKPDRYLGIYKDKKDEKLEEEKGREANEGGENTEKPDPEAIKLNSKNHEAHLLGIIDSENEITTLKDKKVLLKRTKEPNMSKLAKEILKQREKKKDMVDILSVLSDYNTYESD